MWCSLLDTLLPPAFAQQCFLPRSAAAVPPDLLRCCCCCPTLPPPPFNYMHTPTPTHPATHPPTPLPAPGAADPESLVPQLPKPRDLQPFPTLLALRFCGHTQAVRAGVHADGHRGGVWAGLRRGAAAVAGFT